MLYAKFDLRQLLASGLYHRGQLIEKPRHGEMVKADIVKEISSGLNRKDSEALIVVDKIIESIKDIILEDRRLEIRDFGVFQVKERKPRIGRNPKNKVAYPIPPHSVVTFKPGKDMKELPLDTPVTAGSDDDGDDEDE